MSFAILDGKALTSSITDEGLTVWAVWMAILADKDQDGITSLTPNFLAKVFKHKDSHEIEEAFKILSSPDPQSKNKEHEGRRIIPLEDGRWLVVSHEKYKQIYRKEVRREYLAQAKRAQRERDRKREEKKHVVSPAEAAKAFHRDTPDQTSYKDDSLEVESSSDEENLSKKVVYPEDEELGF